MSKSNVSRIAGNILHEGFHVHTYKDEEIGNINVLVNEFKAYLLNQYVNIYSNALFDLPIRNYELEIPYSDRKYFLDNCKNLEDLKKFLEDNKNNKSYIAYNAVNQMMLDMNEKSDISILYLDFIWANLSSINSTDLDIFSFIDSCNPKKSALLNSLRSAFIDYDLSNESLNFPTTRRLP